MAEKTVKEAEKPKKKATKPKDGGKKGPKVLN